MRFRSLRGKSRRAAPHARPPDCECFASGVYCDGCNCKGCCNNPGHEAVRLEAVDGIMGRNPNAFRPKVAATTAAEAAVGAPPRHFRGCHCKKSGCLKRCARPPVPPLAPPCPHAPAQTASATRLACGVLTRAGCVAALLLFPPP